MNVSDFKDWVNSAKKGKRVVYTETRKTPDESFYRSDIMEAARRAYKDGRVTLVQRRTTPARDWCVHSKRFMDGDNCFDYIAVRT